MSIDIIIDFICCFVSYICVGMMIAVFINDMDYFVHDYYLVVVVAYQIIILILLYVDFRNLLKEIKNNLRRY